MNYHCPRCGANHKDPEVTTRTECNKGPLENPCGGALEPAPDNLFDLEEGKHRKAEGQDLVEHNGPWFAAWAREELTKIAESRPSRTVDIDDLRYAAIAQGIKPHHSNCWGPVFKNKRWELVRRKHSTFITNNAHLINVWRLREETT